MDWGGWALFGLVATTALTAVMIAAQLGGLSRLDLPLILGSVVTEDPDRARVAGFFIHLAIGQGFALGYAASFALLGRASWWVGGLLGLLHVAVALTVLVPLLAGVHPRMASSRAGPPRGPCWSRPGCLASTTAPRPPLSPLPPTSPTASRSVCCSRPTDVRRLWPSPGEIDPVDAYGRLPRLGPRRPGLRLNMIASVDGAASVAGRSGALGGRADKALFAVLRSLADVILVGAGTVRAEGYGPVHLDERKRARRHSWGLAAVPPIAVVTRACRLDWASPFFHDAEQRPLVVTVASALADDRGRAAEVAEVVVAGDTEVDLWSALASLAGRGYDNVLAEGGPALAAGLAVAGLLDELCLTLSPLLAGGGAARILAGGALAPPIRLELAHLLHVDDYLFLRYRRR